MGVGLGGGGAAPVSLDIRRESAWSFVKTRHGKTNEVTASLRRSLRLRQGLRCVTGSAWEQARAAARARPGEDSWAAVLSVLVASSLPRPGGRCSEPAHSQPSCRTQSPFCPDIHQISRAALILVPGDRSFLSCNIFRKSHSFLVFVFKRIEQ